MIVEVNKMKQLVRAVQSYLTKYIRHKLWTDKECNCSQDKQRTSRV